MFRDRGFSTTANRTADGTSVRTNMAGSMSQNMAWPFTVVGTMAARTKKAALSARP
jgi:hypothetical protein